MFVSKALLINQLQVAIHEAKLQQKELEKENIPRTLDLGDFLYSIDYLCYKLDMSIALDNDTFLPLLNNISLTLFNKPNSFGRLLALKKEAAILKESITVQGLVYMNSAAAFLIKVSKDILTLTTLLNKARTNYDDRSIYVHHRLYDLVNMYAHGKGPHHKSRIAKEAKSFRLKKAFAERSIERSLDELTDRYLKC